MFSRSPFERTISPVLVISSVAFYYILFRDSISLLRYYSGLLTFCFNFVLMFFYSTTEGSFVCREAGEIRA
jgi:hypothetical protein